MAVEVLGAAISSKIKAQLCIDFARILALKRNVPNFVLYLPLIAVWFLLMVMAYCVKVDFPHPCVSRFVKLTVEVCGLALTGNAVRSKRRAGRTGAQYTAAGGVFPPCARVTRSSRQQVCGPSCCDVSGFVVLRDGICWFDVERFPLMHVLVAHHRVHLLYVRGVCRHGIFFIPFGGKVWASPRVLPPNREYAAHHRCASLHVRVRFEPSVLAGAKRDARPDAWQAGLMFVILRSKWPLPHDH